MAQNEQRKALLDVEQRRQPVEGCHEDLPCTPPFPNDRTHYGWSCIQFVYVAGAHYCWVMGSGITNGTSRSSSTRPANYNADGTFKASSDGDGVTYPVGTGPYPDRHHAVDTSGGIFFAGEMIRM